MTDTFGRDLNYCWLTYFRVKANTIRGAMWKVSRETGLKFRNNGSYYKAKGDCIGIYEVDYEWLNDDEIQEQFGDKFIDL